MERKKTKKKKQVRISEEKRRTAGMSLSSWVCLVALFLLLNIVCYVAPEEEIYEEYSEAKLLNSIDDTVLNSQIFDDLLISKSLNNEDGNGVVPIISTNRGTDLNDPFSDDIKIVGTADGFIHAVDSGNNKIWSASTGGPMASHHNSGNLDYNVIPATDGSLLVQSSQGMRKTSVKARMLAESAPIMTQEGLLLTGQKTSRILGVDISSGRVLHDTMAADNLGRVNSLSTLQNNKPKLNKKVIQQPLWVGRTDYTLRAFDGATGIEEFNMTFSEIHPVIADTNDDAKSIDTVDNINHLSPESQSVSPTRRNKAIAATSIHISAKSSPPLLSTPEGDVFFTDQTGEIHHGIPLGSPAVTAFSVSSQSNNADKIRATDTNYDIRPLQISHRLAPALGKPVSESSESENNVVLVKSLNDGGIYAIEIPVDDVKSMILSIDNSASSMLSLPSPKSSDTTDNPVAILKPLLNNSEKNEKTDKEDRSNIPEGIYANDGTNTKELSWEKRFATTDTNPVAPVATASNWRYYASIALLIVLGGIILARSYLQKRIKPFLDEKIISAEEKQVEVVDNAVSVVSTNNHELEKELKEEVDKDGRKVLRIGSLTYFPSIVLGYGSHGTVVFRGSLNGRPVAIKRMLSQFNRAADREISLLIRSDGHPNVVRYFLKEQQGEFVYLALQLAKMSLKDFVLQLQKYMSRNKGSTHESSAALSEVPDAARMALLQIAKGLAHLHSQRIVHRDIKPHNILCALPDELLLADDFSTGTCSDMKSIDNLGDYILKISDMGLSKQLDKDEASFASMSMSMPTQVSSLSTFGSSSLSTNENKQGSRNVANEGPVGTIGWQAPELMALRGSGMNNVSSDALDNADEEEGESDDDNGENIIPQSNSTAAEVSVKTKLGSGKAKESSKLLRRKTQNVDIFSLGCVFHYVLVPGMHPYGQWYEREANIMQGKPDLSRISHMPDAIDLLQRMLEKDPTNRPSAIQVSNHPFFWFSQTRLSFLIALSDKLEHEPLDSATTLSLEANAESIVTRSWDRKLHASLIEDVGKYRKYDYSSVRDLLRLIRNKKNHYHELPASVKELIGSMPSGYVSYFESKFPKLLMRCVEISCRYFPTEKTLTLYCEPIVSLFGGNDIGSGKSDNGTVPQSSSDLIQDLIVEGNSVGNAYGNMEPTSAEVTVWHSSAISDSLSKGKGWWRESDVWVAYTCSHGNNSSIGSKSKGRPAHLTKSATDMKYRSRLCTHWEITGGTNCPMRKKGKCDFAHGPLELRIKETRRDKWGVYHQSLVDGAYDPLRYSGGEDVLGAARSIEKIRVIEGSVSQFEKSSASSVGGGMKVPSSNAPFNQNKRASSMLIGTKASGHWASVIKDNSNEGFGV